MHFLANHDLRYRLSKESIGAKLSNIIPQGVTMISKLSKGGCMLKHVFTLLVAVLSILPSIADEKAAEPKTGIVQLVPSDRIPVTIPPEWEIVFYDESLIKRKEISMRVQQLFPEALRNEEFLVYYQPKVNIMTGELVGAEALCRWFHDGKIVPPCDFIPMLEETNDICQLDFYMLDHVCRDIHKWIPANT